MADLSTHQAGVRLGLPSAEVLELAKAGALGEIRRNGAGHVFVCSEAVEEYRRQNPPAPAPITPEPEPEPPPPALQRVVVETPEAEPDSSPGPAPRESGGDATASPPPTRRRPRRPSDPLPGAGRTQIVVEPLRQYRSLEDYGPELVRLRAACKSLLRAYGLRVRSLRFLDEEAA